MDDQSTPTPFDPSARDREAAPVRVTSWAWRPWLQLGTIAALLLLAVDMWSTLTGLLESLVIAAFVATALDAVIRILQRRGMGRGRAILTVLLGGFVAVSLLFVLIVPDMVRQGANLIDEAPSIVSDLEQTDAWQYLDENTTAGDALLNKARDLAVELPGLVADTLSAAVGSIFNLVTMFIAVTFLLTSGGRALELFVRVFPRVAEERAWDVVAGAYDNIGKYVIGATMQAAFAGIAITLLLWALGVPYALPLGLFTFLLNYIPLIGATIGAVPAVAVALFAGGDLLGITEIGGLTAALIVTAYIVVYQQIENAIIQPKIQQDNVNIPAIAVFFSVFVGGNIFGIVGALFAVPVASVIAIIIGHWLDFTGRTSVVAPALFDEHGFVIRHKPTAHPAADTSDS